MQDIGAASERHAGYSDDKVEFNDMATHRAAGDDNTL